MAGVAQEKGLEAPNRSSGTSNTVVSRDADETMKSFQINALRALKKTRDDIDAAVPKILTLSQDERRRIGLEAIAAKMIIIGSRATTNLTEKPTSPEEQAGAFQRMVFPFMVDISSIPSSERKAFESLAKENWKKAKATLDEALESPLVRQMLNSKVPVRK